MTDQAATKEALFKQHFTQVLRDLQQDGAQDNEAMAMIGTLARDLAANFGATSWSAAKAQLTRNNYDELLASFGRRGEDARKSGHTKQAYAIQALATSLIAGTQRADAAIAQGEPLLDSLIDRAIAYVAAVERPHSKH